MERQSPRAGTLQPVGLMVTRTLQHAGLGRIALLSQIVQHWEEIVGAPIAAVAYPERVRGRVLFVAVHDAIWLQQLTFCHTQLLQKVRHVLGDVPIVRFHFILATGARPPAPPAVEPVVPVVSALAAADERRMLEETAVIADEELRERVRQAWRCGGGGRG